MMQRTDPVNPSAPGHLLRNPEELPTANRASLAGLGGLHGGLLLGLLTGELAASGIDRPLRFVTAQFHRPAKGTIEFATEEPEIGRSISRVRGSALDSGRTLMTATAVFSDAEGPTVSADIATGVARSFPDVRPPEQCEPVLFPIEFVPFTQHLEIRPTDSNLPFRGGNRPTLSAWVRLVEDDDAPDVGRLIMLLDSMAPSLAGLLDYPAVLPTLELSVRLFSDLPAEDSPWILLHATTHHFEGGWLDERIDAWTPNGTLAGTATQVRLLR
ncbi:MAG: thioesterase family protein [Actinomycetota bacterium]